MTSPIESKTTKPTFWKELKKECKERIDPLGLAIIIVLIGSLTASIGWNRVCVLHREHPPIFPHAIDWMCK